MAATTTRRGVAHTRTSPAQSADMNGVWRLRCQALEERLEDTTAALRASEAERRELSLDYKHALRQLWRANAGLTRRQR
jgi:hypothetical protein